MDRPLMIAAARELSERIQAQLRDPVAETVTLPRLEAAIAAGILDGAAETMERELQAPMDGEDVDQSDP